MDEEMKCLFFFLQAAWPSHCRSAALLFASAPAFLLERQSLELDPAIQDAAADIADQTIQNASIFFYKAFFPCIKNGTETLFHGSPSPLKRNLCHGSSVLGIHAIKRY
jgi:hypothetical protein